MTRTVADAALMLEVMARPEPRDPFAWPVPFAIPKELAASHLSNLRIAGLRIAISTRLGCTAPLVDQEVDALVAEAGPILADAGAEVTDESPIWPVDPLEPFKVFWETGCMATVDGFDVEKHALLDPLLLSVATAGRATSLTAYCRAQELRMAIAVAAKAFFNRFDLLVGPVMPVPAYAVQLAVPEGFDEEDWRWCPYTYPWNMTGQPAVSVPIGFTRSGLPVGVQIIGWLGSEATLLRAAAVIERSRPLHLRRPPLLG
jgi:aspartyl-tRNA(Asn)/glutamyl-tRNA(Gln) amidotransferase subunit A